MQLNMATEQVSHLRATEKQSAIYRHDLRHHMNYLKACIDANKLAEASAYIEQIFEEIRQTQVEQYCSNESINLILASYASKAKQNNLSVDFDIKDVDFSGFQIIDLCSLLSNALENALEACKQMEKSDNRNIRLRIYEKNGKFCFHISNSYALLPVFQHGIPVASKEGHGMGTLSMIHVVEKYNGIYGFHAEDGKFTFRASM